MTSVADSGAQPARAGRSSQLPRLVAGQLGWGVATILLISIVTFFGTNLKSPTELAKASLGQYVSPRQAEVFIQQNHLDRPVVTRYVSWLGQLARGDLGTSVITRRPVSADVMPRLYRTMILTFATLLVSIPLGVFAAVWSARRRGRRPEVALNTVAVILTACPEFVTGLALILIFAVILGWLPVDSGAGIAFGSLSAQIQSYVLPVGTLALSSVPFILRTCRSSVREALTAPYVRAATLRGVKRRRVVWNHAVRIASPTILTAVGLNAVYLLSGVIVVENVFDFPGLGQALLAAVGNGDATTVQAIAVLLGAVFVAISVVMDVIAVLLNPRARAGTA